MVDILPFYFFNKLLCVQIYVFKSLYFPYEFLFYSFTLIIKIWFTLKKRQIFRKKILLFIFHANLTITDRHNKILHFEFCPARSAVWSTVRRREINCRPWSAVVDFALEPLGWLGAGVSSRTHYHYFLSVFPPSIVKLNCSARWYHVTWDQTVLRAFRDRP